MNAPQKLCCALLTLAATSAMAQTNYPDRALRLIVPFAAGSATDSSARIISTQLSTQLGQQIVVDNRAGAGGAIGMQALVKSPADGYTIAYAGAGPLAINRSMSANLPYDVEKEVQAISQGISSPLLLAVSPTLPVKSVKDMIALARTRPGQMSFGSAGNGTVGHLAGEYFKALSKTDILHVPYKGGAQAAVDTMSGFVQFLFDPTSSLAPHITSSRLRGLAVTGSKRIKPFPNLPTVAESGLPGYEVTTWGGIIGPAGIPRPIVTRLSEEVQKATKSALVVERFAALGTDPLGSTPEQFTEFIRKEYLKWADVIKRAGLKQQP
ncbi:MAG: Bug family tripartite tricarboxylate transporter substrate binding protein [Betaproteobacteria bacterium]|jgi:tripartite-type tricarboxylate transporter receptor subunit TctC|nr:tripartite tricarboxylate transporter substrate binding protein [Betaproteobacteria bacterium]